MGMLICRIVVDHAKTKSVPSKFILKEQKHFLGIRQSHWSFTREVGHTVD
jgi:hypothetical protein